MRFRFGRNELNTATAELHCGGQLVHVEPQVLAVLEHLILHRDRVVTKIELLDEVWGSRFVSESALTTRIKSARRAVGDTGRDQQVIRTIHGRGYRFVADLDQLPGVAPADRSRPTPSRGGLIGRAAELAVVEDALAGAGATAGGPRALLLVGPAGIGKSALLADVAERVDDLGTWQLLWGQALPARGASEPYFALLDALSRAGRDDAEVVRPVLDRVAPMWLAQLPLLVEPEDAERLGHRLIGATPERMLREGVEALLELARARPLLLLLEDLHWADPHTLDVLEVIVQRPEPSHLLVVGTARSDWSPVLDLAAAGARSGRLQRIELAPLPADAVDQLVADAFDGAAAAPDLLAVVRRRSGGVPLFVNEILSSWLRAGLITVEDGRVLPVGSVDELDAQVPETVRQLVEQQLARLEPATVAALEAASVAGAEFDAATVAAALGEPLADVDATLTTAARRLHQIDALGGVRWPDGTLSTRFAFTHDLYRQVLHDRIPVHRRSVAHAAIGQALERGYEGRTNAVVAELAEHFVEAADHGRAAEDLRQVGEQASARGAFDAAAHALLGALDHLTLLPSGLGRDAAELRVRMAVGPALVATRGWFGPDVAENYERAMALCDELGPCPEAPFAVYGLATVTELRGEYERTDRLLQPLVDTASEVATEAEELLACSTFHQGKFEQSLEHAVAVLQAWDGSSESVLLSRLAEHPASSCSSWAALSSWYLGRYEESLRFADEAIAIGQRHAYGLSTAKAQRAFLHQLRGEPERCREWASATIELAEAQGFPMRALQGQILLGWADAVMGAPEGAARAEVAFERFRATGARLTEPYFLVLLAECHLAGDRPELAVRLLAEALGSIGQGSRTFFAVPEVHRLMARALVQCGRPPEDDEVRAHLVAAVGAARELRSPTLELRALVELVRVRPDCDDRAIERIARLLDELTLAEDLPDVAAARDVLAASR